MNMREWQEWETEKKERKARETFSQVRPQVLERRKTAETFIAGEEKKGDAKQVKEQGKATEEEKVDSRRSTTTINTVKPAKQKDGKINSSFTASKSSKSTATKPGHPLSTPRQTPDSAKSRSFPSLDTLNSAARSPSPVGISTTSRGLGESWRSGEGGNEEEVLFEVGYSQVSASTLPDGSLLIQILCVLRRYYPLRHRTRRHPIHLRTLRRSNNISCPLRCLSHFKAKTRLRTLTPRLPTTADLMISRLNPTPKPPPTSVKFRLNLRAARVNLLSRRYRKPSCTD